MVASGPRQWLVVAWPGRDEVPGQQGLLLDEEAQGSSSEEQVAGDSPILHPSSAAGLKGWLVFILDVAALEVDSRLWCIWRATGYLYQ